MNLRKVFSIMLAGVMIFSVTACGKKKDKDTLSGGYHTEQAGEVSVKACQNSIENFFTAMKAGDVENVVKYSAGSYPIDQWTENKDELSKLLKYMSEGMQWQFGLDTMDKDNENIINQNSFGNGEGVPFNVAWTYKQWNMAKPVYYQNIAFDKSVTKTADESGYVQFIPKNVTAANGQELYATLDKLSPNIPLVAMTSIDLVNKDGYIRVNADTFFPKLFGSFHIFKNSSNTDGYLAMLLFGEEWNSETKEYNTFEHMPPADSQEAAQISKDIFGFIKDKQDYSAYEYIANSNNEVMSNALSKNYFAKTIKDQYNDFLKTEIDKQYNDIFQIVEDHENDMSGIHTAKVFRFYNTPTNALAAKPDTQMFIANCGAYYNTFVFDAATYNISTPMSALSVLSDYITHQG